MKTPDKVRQLVENFDLHHEQYKQPTYNETQVRREFIDPLFKALGWDIDNEAGYAEQYKEVVHEAQVRVGGKAKAPDYSFRIGGRRLFFLEAKKPAINLKDDPAPAYQLRRYAWSAKMPLSILTDFEEFIVYDTRVKPQKNDKSSKARILYLKYTDYLDRWEEIASIFSPQAIQKGAYDKFVQSTTKKRGTGEVDDAFLAEIENWRLELARNIALRNQQLTQRDINFAVQRTIDRIIFLRICEDRGVEDYGRLQALLNGTETYARLRQLFASADQRYNSGLFHFQKEKDRAGSPDTLTPNLKIDDKILKSIFRNLYYPDSPYEFSVLPPDILGQVYERFLGSVITLSKGHRAKVEEKPEVRKAGGVYYTPTYIVDYIVQHTVGKLLEGKKPGTRGAASRIRILDPACGSGSFLLGAYQHLLDWHLKEYEKDPQKWTKGKNPTLAKLPRGGHRLTTPERKRILLNNIHGVDIDLQAVEVTKLSLLLKVLEDENAQSLDRQLTFYHERALPDLANNIKCGNSLIAPDYYQNQQTDLFDEEETYRVNAFDWKTEFPEIIREGGFNAVIGNPPYGAFFSNDEARYLRQVYETPANSLDSFLIFVERASSILIQGGHLGYIVPSGWASTPSSKPLRRLFLNHFRPLSFVALPFDVFKGAYIDTLIVTAETRADDAPRDEGEVDLFVFPQRFRISNLKDFANFHKTGDFLDWIESDNLEFLITCGKDEARLLNKIRDFEANLGDFVVVKRGVEVFRPQIDTSDFVRPIRAFNGVLQRYRLDLGQEVYVDYTQDVERSKPLPFFSDPRILIRQVLSRRLRLQTVYTEETFLSSQSIQTLLKRDNIGDSWSLKSLLALLNSKAMSWFFQNVNSVARRDDFPKIIIAQTRTLPIPEFPGKRTQKTIVALIDRMIDLKERISSSTTDHEHTLFERQISATDQEIDRLVYELYDLTDKEIAIVENNVKIEK